MGSEYETDEDDEGDYVDQLPQKLDNKYKKPRGSISSEVFGIWNKKGEFQPKKVPKSPATVQKIVNRLGQSFMFSHLDEKEKVIVIDAMQERLVKPGETIIRQGD